MFAGLPLNWISTPLKPYGLRMEISPPVQLQR